MLGPMSHVVCIGDLGLDRYVGADRTFVGGQAFNVALLLSRDLGADKVVLFAPLPPEAEALRRKVASLGVQSVLEPVAGETPRIEIELNMVGEKKYLDYKPGVLESWKLSSQVMKAVESARVVCVPGYLGVRSITSRVVGASRKGLLFCDLSDLGDLDTPSLRAREVEWTLTQADVVLLSGGHDWEDLARLAEEGFPGKLLVVTLGGAGSIAIFRGERIEVPSVEVESIVDTTGAGDSMMSALVAGWIRSETHPPSEL
jgi:sugar/nucleoside kinase (ribokinase family)